MRGNGPVGFVVGVLFLVVAASAAYAEPDAATKTALAWQIALDRVAFSPGVIDGKGGAKTQLATREFQRANHLRVTGQADANTAAALQIDAAKAVTSYTIRAQDSEDVGPAPKSWLEKSKLPRLAYESLAALVGEKFHCSQLCLAALNPGKDLAKLKAGDALTVPNIAGDVTAAQGRKVEISFADKIIRVLDDANHLVGLFPCSIAKDKENLPTVRQTSVVVIVNNPTYKFDPEMWPEVKDVHETLIIPAGPRNPVGLCWMGLELKGYGMHGTPMPDMIGKTGSHGCFRLTNWDALRLSKMIRVGTPVAFTAGSAEGAAAAGGATAHTGSAGTSSSSGTSVGTGSSGGASSGAGSSSGTPARTTPRPPPAPTGGFD